MQFCGAFKAQISELCTLLKMQEPPGHSNMGWAWLVYSEMSCKMATEVPLARWFQSETPRKYFQIMTLTSREKCGPESVLIKSLKLSRTLWGIEWAEEGKKILQLIQRRIAWGFFVVVVVVLICLSHTMLYIMFLKSLV